MLLKGALALEFSFAFVGRFVHPKLTSRRAPPPPGMHRVMPPSLSPAFLLVPPQGPRMSCFLPLMLLSPLPQKAFSLPSPGSSPLQPPSLVQPVALCPLVFPLCLLKQIRGRNRGLGVKSSGWDQKLSLVAASSWATTSDARCHPR